MRKGMLLMIVSIISLGLMAQEKTPITVQILQQQEALLKQYAQDIVLGEETIDRSIADSIFTKLLVQSLKIPYSFSYPFDSLQTISKLYAPDSSFRIFSWQVMKDFSYYRQKGAIQFPTKDGSLKLIPLYDYSSFTDQPTDSVRSNTQWIGAIYYKIILTKHQGKNYYTLLGLDEHNERSTRKWMEVMYFNSEMKPVFGGPFFQMATSQPSTLAHSPYRFLYEYKKKAGARLNYDEDLKIISFAHLVSESGEPQNTATLIPDGSFEGFKWVNGKWHHIPFVTELDPRGSMQPKKQ